MAITKTKSCSDDFHSDNKEGLQSWHVVSHHITSYCRIPLRLWAEELLALLLPSPSPLPLPPLLLLVGDEEETVLGANSNECSGIYCGVACPTLSRSHQLPSQHQLKAYMFGVITNTKD